MKRSSDDPRGPGILLAAVLLLCCAIPFLLASGVSIVFIKPYWPLAGSALAIAGAVAFIWYVIRGWPKRKRDKRGEL